MNRSEELCKLLGVEPKEYLRPDDEIYSGNKQETMRDIDVIYPDLTKPSNFVQLLKIHPKGTSSFFHKCEDFIHSIYGVKSLEDDIIGTIIDKVFPSLTTRHKNLAKHQAQATKWDY